MKSALAHLLSLLRVSNMIAYAQRRCALSRLKPILFVGLAVTLALASGCKEEKTTKVFREESTGIEVTYNDKAWKKVEAVGETGFFCSGSDCSGLLCSVYGSYPGFKWPETTDKASLDAVDAFLLNQSKPGPATKTFLVQPTSLKTIGGRETLVNIMGTSSGRDTQVVTYWLHDNAGIGLMLCNGNSASIAAAKDRLEALVAGIKLPERATTPAKVVRDESGEMEVTYDDKQWKVTDFAMGSTFFCIGPDCGDIVCAIYPFPENVKWPATIDKTFLEAVDLQTLSDAKAGGGESAKATMVQPSTVTTLNGRETLVNIIATAGADSNLRLISYMFKDGSQERRLTCLGESTYMSASASQIEKLVSGIKLLAK